MTRYAVAGALLALGLGGALLADEKALKELEGTYRAVALIREGKDAPAEFTRGVTLRIAADEMTFTVKEKSFPAKIAVDPGKKPATIDIAPTDGPEKGRTFPGIYKVEKGELVLAFTEKGDRPTEFTGEGDVLLVRLRRDPKAGK
jgi:uncharacterized protein (TIGR03067 family)